ncbi:MAG: DUF3604 domain-containing protein [Marinibacterium sp.]|nr:DUF3604 domain-containing protein [Marinibacterium sp.]
MRFFGGWEFDTTYAQSRLPGDIGYAKGVPMGDDLSDSPQAGAAPNFLIAALKDPYSGNLERIQVVKGWLDANGETQERVFGVVWSGDRKPGEDGKLPDVGNTADAGTSTFSNSIRAPELISVWTDPEFDPNQSAFFFARVLEIPTPCWSVYFAVQFGDEIPEDVPVFILLRKKGRSGPRCVSLRSLGKVSRWSKLPVQNWRNASS